MRQSHRQSSCTSRTEAPICFPVWASLSRSRKGIKLAALSCIRTKGSFETNSVQLCLSPHICSEDRLCRVGAVRSLNTDIGIFLIDDSYNPPGPHPLPEISPFLVLLKEHSSNGKGGGFYSSAHISQSINSRKLNLVSNDSRQKSYLGSTFILALMSKKL